LPERPRPRKDCSRFFNYIAWATTSATATLLKREMHGQMLAPVIRTKNGPHNAKEEPANRAIDPAVFRPFASVPFTTLILTEKLLS
jgi:hypothetical protein